MATYNTVPLQETAADDKPLLARNVNVSVKKILGAAVLVSFVIGSLAAVAVEPPDRPKRPPFQSGTA